MEDRWVTDSKPATATRCSQSYDRGEQGRLSQQKRGACDSGIGSREVTTTPRPGGEEKRVFQVEPNVREHSMLQR